MVAPPVEHAETTFQVPTMSPPHGDTLPQVVDVEPLHATTETRTADMKRGIPSGWRIPDRIAQVGKALNRAVPKTQGMRRAHRGGERA
jgi:hypothetical protein